MDEELRASGLRKSDWVISRRDKTSLITSLGTVKYEKTLFKNKETVFLSLKEASRELNIERKTIMSSIENNRELTKGNLIGYRFLHGN